MSIDMSWSAKSLQAPVHSHLTRVHHAMKAAVAEHMANKVKALGPHDWHNQPVQMPTADANNTNMDGGSPFKNAAAFAKKEAAHPYDLAQIFGQQAAAQAAKNAAHPGVFTNITGVSGQTGTGTANPLPDASGGMGVDLNFLRPQKGTNILPTLADKIMQPGVDPSITAAVPQAPKEGIPQMQSASGWMTPGANFTISPNTF